MLWVAWLLANTCMWMCDVAAAWLMTTLSNDPVLVALVQTASALPVFLLALPSGAMADILDRRRWFLATQLWLAATATLLALAAGTGALSAPVLLSLVFANGVGMALRWPVFAAILPGVVGRDELPQALGLHGMAANASRIIGPLAAGVLLAQWGSIVVFAASAALALVAALLTRRWRYTPATTALPSERLLGAMRVGLQFVVQSPPMRVALLRIFVLFLQVSSLLALLPLVAKGLGDGSAATYTTLFSCMGLGAVAAAVWLPRLRRRAKPQAVVTVGTLLLSGCTAIVALAPNPWIAAPAMVAAGGTWLAVANAVNLSAQLALPDWVRARGMSIFLMAAMGGGALGAALFGAAAGRTGVHDSLLLLAALSLVMLWALRGWRLADRGSDEFEPQRYAARPTTSQPVDPEAGPVVVTIEYFVDEKDTQAFAQAMAQTRRARLQGGALSWSLLRDTTQTRRYVETFVDSTWLAHLRRFDRLTAADARLRERRLALHRGTQAPRVTRYVSEPVAEIESHNA